MNEKEIDIVKGRIRDKHRGDEKQLEVVFSSQKRLLVEAPAGYGKTNTMVSRIAYLIAVGQIPVPKRLLALTFSVNAAYKIKKDISSNIPQLLYGLSRQVSIKDKIYVSNYHGFCRNVLKKYGRLIHPALAELDILQSIDDSRADTIMGQFKNLQISEANVLSDFSGAVKNIDANYLKDNIDSYNSIVIAKIIDSGALPYNAIITLTIKLFKEYPNILKFYRSYYTTILVDEFQDTNLLSYWLLCVLITDKTNVLLLGDSLQRIYGFIGAIPNLLTRTKRKFSLEQISLDRNYRFASNLNMLNLDKLMRQCALTPFENPMRVVAEIPFNIYEDQDKEASGTVTKASEILQQDSTAKVAILVKQRGLNVDAIIDAFNEKGVSFFYGLFTDEDGEYVKFNKRCLYEFIELLKIELKISKRLRIRHIARMQKLYQDENSALIDSFFRLLSVFWDRLFVEYGSLSNEDKLNLVKDTFEHNGIKQYMEFLDIPIIITTVHAAKGLEWDYVILPDMEKDLFPSWIGLCGKCNCGETCNFKFNKNTERAFLEELSVFYVAVTRARKQVYFSCSKRQRTKYGDRSKNISCFMKLPGMKY